MWAIVKKEIKTYFLSPIGYVFIGSFLLMSSFFFYIYIYQYGTIEYSSLFYYTSELLTFTIALLTMGMFASERKNGTETLLLTAPRGITSIVIGKFLAAVLVIVITEIFSLMYYVILCCFAGAVTNVPETIATLIGFILMTMSYISFGMFISSLTENQIIAGVVTIVLLLASWFLPNLSETLYIISPIALFQKYPEGIIASGETITLLTQTIMFILLTIIAMQRRKLKCLRQTGLAILLFAIIITIFVGINLWINKLDLTDIDLTSEKLYTLTDESKEQIKRIPQDEQIQIYLFDYIENSSVADLAKQYSKINENIKIEIENSSDRKDLVSKYGIEEGEYSILITSGEKYKIIDSYDLYTYDYNTGTTIDLAEQKLTNGILSVSSVGKITKLYILKGHGEYSIENMLASFKTFLESENYEINELDLLVQESIPEDCEALIISSPEKDFSDAEREKIKQYINKGGNILWMSDTQTGKGEQKNIQTILDMYGVQLHLNGFMIEQDISRIVMQSPDLILPIINNTELTKELSTEGTVLFLDSSKLTFVSDEELEKLRVVKTEILTTSDKAFFRTDFTQVSTSPIEGEEVGKQVIGASLEKTIDENKVSRLVIYANNYFATDASVKTGQQEIPAIYFYNNLDLILNSVAYVSNVGDQITIRKSIEMTTYTATAMQDNVIRIIIFSIPILIVIVRNSSMAS